MSRQHRSRSRDGSPAKVLASTYALADRWIRLRRDTVQLQDGRTISSCPVFEHPDWVDVIALTDEFNIVLVDQYRHAVDERRTEFPAGTVDDVAEAPLAAIKRELLEETGYASDDWRLLGSAPVYPALQTNRIHSFLALGAQRIAQQELDPGEVVHAYELPLSVFIDRVQSGEIELPALQLAGMFWLQAHLRKSTDQRLASLRF